MNFIKKYQTKFVLMVYLFIVPVVKLYAEGSGTQEPVGKIINPLAGNGVNDLPTFIRIILEGALKIGIPIIALAVIYSGFLFVFARGNSEKLTKAKDALLYTIIGAAILLGSLAIAKMIQVTITGLGA